MPILNISSYKFIDLHPGYVAYLQSHLKEQGVLHNIKGTILLSTEGINLFMAGEEANLQEFIQSLTAIEEFKDLYFKRSYSETIPYRRLIVRIKAEIISFGQNDIKPQQETAPYITPEQLKEWYEKDQDMLVLDTRNDYEVNLGTFKNAESLAIENFRQFPEAVEGLLDQYRDKPIVTFCTGGIRCEKAAAYMLKKGFTKVYQLEGGILNYFEKCGGEYYQGDCFVFDDRIAINEKFEESSH